MERGVGKEAVGFDELRGHKTRWGRWRWKWEWRGRETGRKRRGKEDSQQKGEDRVLIVKWVIHVSSNATSLSYAVNPIPAPPLPK